MESGKPAEFRGSGGRPDDAENGSRRVRHVTVVPGTGVTCDSCTRCQKRGLPGGYTVGEHRNH